MGSSNIRDVLTCFSPSFDLFAITSGDGRIKIWDTVKGQLQTEFSDIVSTEAKLFNKAEERGHLSLDYTCMKWVSFDRKKKRKLGTSLLVLGTGSGDVLALDVSAGQLKWKISDCHPGGVCAITYAPKGSCIYTSGADGMVCEVDALNGNLSRKFKASTKAVSSICISPDGKMLATAAAQVKIFGCADLKKIQKFTGHPGAVRCMTMSEDGKYVFSSGTGERYVAVWRADGSKKKSAACVLAMEHPSVYLECRHIDNGDANDVGFYVLAISEWGVCYVWFGKDIEELRKANPAKISLSSDEDHLKSHKGVPPTIFAARILSVAKASSINVTLAQGFLIKPSFEKVVVHHGEDLRVNIARNGLLLPVSQARKTKKQLELQTGATALDRSNAEGAVLPAPMVLDHDIIKQDQSSKLDLKQSVYGDTKDVDVTELDTAACPMEDRLKSLEILGHLDSATTKSIRQTSLLKDNDLETILPPRKMRATILSLIPSDAYKTLNSLIDMWQSRSCSGKYVLPWIYNILVHHGQHIMTQEPDNASIHSLYKIVKSRGSAAQSLLQLSGRLQLVTAQIDKAAELKANPMQHEDGNAESEDDDEDESVDDVLFGDEDGESETSDEDSD